MIEMKIECQGCAAELKAWTLLKQANNEVYLMVQPCPHCIDVARGQKEYLAQTADNRFKHAIDKVRALADDASDRHHAVNPMSLLDICNSVH